jgi:hypothetical protein
VRRARRCAPILTLCALLAGCIAPAHSAPTCDGDGMDTLVLMAQSVPGARLVPCIDALPVGWSVDHVEIESGRSHLQLRGEGPAAGPFLAVTLAPGCEVDDAVPVPSDEDHAQRFETVEVVADGFVGRRFYVFDGGCVVYDFDVHGQGWSSVVNDAALALTFAPRPAIDRYVRERTGGVVQRL